MRTLRFNFPWLHLPHLQRLLDLLETTGGQARFVGGAVRDSLLGKTPADFDIAVSLAPEQVMACLNQAGIRTIPTGLKHGTVTAILNQQPVEITTLREDIETDGRHATVRFTNSFQADAARRDFTMNALFLDKQGHLYDFFQGVEDLQHGIVRFIGNPLQRVEEDHLRILRFFRFQAYYGIAGIPLHPQSLQACLKTKDCLNTLSKERITHEWLKLLKAPSPFEVLTCLVQEGIVDIIQGGEGLLVPSLLKKIAALAQLEQEMKTEADALVRLFLLSHQGTNLERLSLSKDQHKILKIWQKNKISFSQSDVQKAYYHLDSVLAVKGLLWLEGISLLEQHHPIEGVAQDFQHLKTYLESASKPTLPICGKDLLARGIPQGKQIKTWLCDMETWWITSNFIPDRKACLKELDKRLSKNSSRS